MLRYLDSQFKTKFDAMDKTIVFTTSKTLNERFTPSPPTRNFIINNGYTAPYEDNYISERVAFKNRKSMDIHRRISLYQQGDLNLIEREVFGYEDKNSLKFRLAEIGNRRRTVLMPREWCDEVLTEYYHEEPKEPIALLPDYYNIESLANPIEVRTSRNLKFYDFVQSQQSGGSDCKFGRNSVIFDSSPVKRRWDGRIKGKDDYRLKESKGSEPIVYKPPSSRKDKRYFRQSLYKWKRAKPTKEELDDELDRYMAEVKFKEVPITPVKDDVDYFIKEYMLETEKSLNENANINLE